MVDYKMTARALWILTSSLGLLGGKVRNRGHACLVGLNSPVLRVYSNDAETLGDSHATADTAKDGVLAVQERRWREGDEELGTCSVV